jgi:hypothetical protein
MLKKFTLFTYISFFLCYCFSVSAQKTDKVKTIGGIGVSLMYDSTAGYPYIVQVLSAKPAAMAGLRSGDYVLRVNNKSTAHKKAERITEKLKGKPGKPVMLRIGRGDREFDTILVREEITLYPKPENFCGVMDTIFRLFPDTFRHLRAENPWEVSLRFPGSDNGYLVTVDEKKNDPKKAFFIDYYLCRDSLQGYRQYKNLLENVEMCLKFSCCDEYTEGQRNFCQAENSCAESKIIKLTQLKPGYPDILKSSTLRITHMRTLGVSTVAFELVYP